MSAEKVTLSNYFKNKTFIIEYYQQKFAWKKEIGIISKIKNGNRKEKTFSSKNLIFQNSYIQEEGK